MNPYAHDIMLATSVLRGDSTAVSHLFTSYCAPVVEYYVRTNTRRCQDCFDEVMQEVCMEIFHHGEWRPVRNWLDVATKRASLKTYLKTVVIRTGRRRCRRCRSDTHHARTTTHDLQLDVVSPMQNADEAVLGMESRSALLSAIGQLESPPQRAVMIGFFHGRSIREIAAALGESENNVSQMKSRALVRLRAMLDPNTVSPS